LPAGCLASRVPVGWFDPAHAQKLPRSFNILQRQQHGLLILCELNGGIGTGCIQPRAYMTHIKKGPVDTKRNETDWFTGSNPAKDIFGEVSVTTSA
jgi:hypothetical protein